MLYCITVQFAKALHGKTGGISGTITDIYNNLHASQVTRRFNLPGHSFYNIQISRVGKHNG